MRDYFPLVEGRRWEYESRSPSGEGALVLECLAVKGDEAEFRREERFPGRPDSSTRFAVRRDAAGVKAGGDLVFPLPLKVGRSWDRPPRRYSIEAFDGKAGAYSGCLVVQYTIAGGDAGFGRRYYAPGVGFVQESCADEADPFEVVLSRMTDR